MFDMIHAIMSMVLAYALSWAGDGHVISHPAVPEAVKNSASSSGQLAAAYPPAVQSALKQLRKSGGQSFVRAEGKTYVVIGIGERPTGGYQLAVERIKQNGDLTFEVDVREHKPAPGTWKTQVITYPTIVVTLPREDAKVLVNMLHE
jgi:hypothetical protein